MKVLSVVVLSLMSLSCIAAHSSKRSEAFKAVRKCAKENALDFNSVSHYFKGNFEVKETKCFLKCVANELGFWINEAPQKETMMKFVDILVKNTEGTSDIIDACIAEDVSDDFCDHLHNVYKCFWSKAMDKTGQKMQSHDFNFEAANELTKE